MKTFFQVQFSSRYWYLINLIYRGVDVIAKFGWNLQKNEKIVSYREFLIVLSQPYLQNVDRFLHFFLQFLHHAYMCFTLSHINIRATFSYTSAI